MKLSPFNVMHGRQALLACACAALVALALALVSGASWGARPAGASEVRDSGAAMIGPADLDWPNAASLDFAVIGDFGEGGAHEAKVARMVASWRPELIIATGDCYYGGAGGTGVGKYAHSVGRFYGRWVGAHRASASANATESDEASENAFFPSLGNHDYSTAGLDHYLHYFDLPGPGFASSSGNERYYDFVEGPVHFFVLNSNRQEPDGVGSTSKQAWWLRTQLAASISRWNVVYFHHPPYSSDDTHGSSRYMRWPFAKWGANVVISGHAHDYERVMQNGIVYLVNGCGGGDLRGFDAPLPHSVVRSARWGAQYARATPTTLEFDFYDSTGRLLDRCRLGD